MKIRVLAASLLVAASASAPLQAFAAETPAARATQAAYSVPDPAAQLGETVRQFRRGDVTALAQSLVPPSRWEELRIAYEYQRQKPISEHDREEFAEKLAELTGPGAIDRIMDDISPKMAEARAQWPGAQLMAFGAMSMAVESPDSDLTESQREALRSAIPGVQSWISATNFLDEATLRQALELLAEGVRKTGVTDLEQIRNMPIEALLDRGRSVLAAGKQAARLYGLDLDAIADSFQVEVLEIDGETARVRSSVRLFGAPVWADHDLVLVDGRWYGKEIAKHWKHSIHFDDDHHHGHGHEDEEPEVEVEIERGS
ncbi:hypothetical protein [Pseudomarimonas salicorniae]|uniref:Uncharacterized protein n=1 Tax=Pseudomarimonas salicorniae TaxID=2933270 RepID=A0ABT0GGT3_9GAMM|nr:hypothetical protein [Lysobacter sp. CAU 1642]MCK7593736.1 hypothetical protein [Lysobacter sp. CAU 1642]